MWCGKYGLGWCGSCKRICNDRCDFILADDQNG